MKNMFSSTAVTRTKNNSFVVATANDGLFIEKNGVWKNTLPRLNYHIRDLKCTGKIIYGVGDKGIFIRSTNEGETWRIQRFPTKASVWSITCNPKGLVVAHGEKVIYISTNYGETWNTLYPFQFSNPPSIRSLCLYKDSVFIGTKVHPKHGGVWMVDLLTNEVRRIKIETSRMISSMLVHKHVLVTVSGACREKNGALEFLPLNGIKHKTKLNWKVCYSSDGHRSYLDVCAHNDVLYTTSSQNEEGYSFISRVNLENYEQVPCDFIRGHAWRICNENENYIVAGLYETKYYKKDSINGQYQLSPIC
ncbi:hypothetical protein [Priestia megaterium]|uniref:WD40/YVTN/BNR-like repeat-containing protein n=1 Tax=Priestia megaterium TaxID=1404 RepID=UPI0031739D6F